MAGRLEFPEGEILEVLRRAGHEGKKVGVGKWMYFCVFHADGRNANMSVDERKNVFHCFACPEEGGVVDLARQLDVEYRTADGAVHRAGEKARGRGRPSNEEMWREWAAALWTGDGEEALGVLRARGLRDDTLRAHSIGVSHRLFQNEVGGAWRVTVPIFDEKGGLMFIRRYHPQGRLRRWLEHVVLLDDPSRISPVAGKAEEQTADCPACGVELRLSPSQAETEIGCPSCAGRLRVNARLVKMWGGEHATLYGLQMLADMRRTAAEKPDLAQRAVVVGGEWDRLMLIQNGIQAVTGTHGESTWKPEWTAALDGLHLVVMLDDDEAGRKGAAKIARSVQERSRVRSLRVVRIPFRDDDRLPSGGRPKDATDWFRIGRTADELLAAIDMAEPLALSIRPGGDGSAGSLAIAPPGGGGGGGDHPPGSPGDDIDVVRELGKEVPAFRKRRMIWRIVRDSLGSRGKFLRTRDRDLYYFDTGERRLHVVVNEEFEAFMMDAFALNPVETEYKYVKEELAKEATRRGERVRVRRFCHWVRDTNLLYISQFDGNMARISESAVDVVPNGTDGVVYLDAVEDSEAWSFVGDPAALPMADAIAEIMRYVDDITFDPARCPADVASRLLFLWIVSVFFGAGMKTRPICTFLGERGSGKTLAFRRLLQLCYGPEADVSSVRHDNQDDMQAAVMSNFLVVFDNVDQDADFMNDELAKIATGHRIVRRQLYTTLASKTYKPDCFVGVTAHTPHFTRSDVIDRMLLFRVMRRPEFGVEPTIGAADRSRFFSAIAALSMRILAAVRDGKRPPKSQYRLADWSTMAFMIGVSVGWDEREMEALMSATEWLRVDLQAEEDPLVDLVARWLADSDLREGRVYRAAELVTEWNAILEKERSKIRYHAKWAGKKIKDAMPALSKRWKITIEHDAVENLDTYRFDRLKNGDGKQSDLASYMMRAMGGTSMSTREAGDDDGSPTAEAATVPAQAQAQADNISETFDEDENPEDDDTPF